MNNHTKINEFDNTSECNIIHNAVYELCLRANTIYPGDLYEKLKIRYNRNQDKKTSLILKNIKIASETERPLCQDTGQVLVFLKIGNQINLKCDINTVINDAVKKAYKDFYFRKSTVKNAVFERINTNSNTPALIYHEITAGNTIQIDILIKGAGAENYSALKMFKPSDGKAEILQFIKETINNAGEKACPPLVLGIGAGGTMEQAALLSKKAFFESKTDDEKSFAAELSDALSDEELLDIRVLTGPSHIASLPVAVTLNCHCTRHAKCTIENDIVVFEENSAVYQETDFAENAKEVNVDDIETLSALKTGEEVLLSGEIYTARDAAHKRLTELIEKGEPLPFDIKNKIIFYAGPCPDAPGEIIGPVGPTTAARMDKFLQLMHSQGMYASIGKGERSDEAVNIIKDNNGRYFSAQGGISCVLAQKVEKSDLIAFEDLGTEGIYKLRVKRFPVIVNI